MRHDQLTFLCVIRALNVLLYGGSEEQRVKYRNSANINTARAAWRSSINITCCLNGFYQLCRRRALVL